MIPIEVWPVSLVPVLFVAVPTSVIILVYAYLKIRPKFPVRVNCWFCHKNSDVPYDNRNCWDCPHCEQYNGFSADGGYNKVIPAQHDELLNHSVTAKSSFTKKSPPSSNKSPLCRKCTINQDLKIQQLASFTPRDPAFFEEEVEEYRQHLERAYQLCDACELVVKKTLQQQQGWLLDQHRKHLLSLHSLPSQRVVAWWQRGLPTVWLQRAQIVSALSAFGLLLSHSHGVLANSFNQYISPDLAYLLEVAPAYDHIIASVLSCAIIIITGCSTYRRTVDIMTAVLWFVLLLHKWLLLWPYMKSHVNEDDLKMGHVIVIGLTFLVNAVAACTSRQVCSSKPLVVKRLKDDVDRVLRGRDITEHFNSPGVAVGGEHSSDKSSLPCPSENSLSPRSPSSPADGSVEQHLYSPVQPLGTPKCGRPAPVQASVCHGELEWGLGNLTLGPSNVSNRNNLVFNSNAYSTGSGANVFSTACHNTTGYNNSRHSNLLRPPKLNVRRNVTQTSWVAGGYWRELGGTLSQAVQSGRNFLETSLQSPSSFSPASRTSSQSSGFHSRSSNSPASSPNSYSGSWCGGEGDRLSVLSDPAGGPRACHCWSSEHPSAQVAGLPIMGMPYYGGFPICVPHVYPLNLSSASPGIFNRSIPWVVNPQYFGVPKQYLQGSCCCSPFPQPLAKQHLPSAATPSDEFSHSGSSVRSKDCVIVPGHMKKNMQNMWQIMKQHALLSVLCIGSVLVNVIGTVMLVYKNSFVFKV